MYINVEFRAPTFDDRFDTLYSYISFSSSYTTTTVCSVVKHSPASRSVRSTKLVFNKYHRGVRGVVAVWRSISRAYTTPKTQKKSSNSLCRLSLNETDLHVVLSYDSQKVDIVVRVEPRHVLAADGFRPKHLHLPVQSVVHHQIVGHANPVWLHGVPLTVVIVPDLGCQRTK